MHKSLPLLALALGLLTGCKPAGESVPLHGDWSVKLADGSVSSVSLPGTLGDAKLGPAAEKAVYGALTLRHQYIGKAVYTRTVTVPAELAGPCELYLERVMWKSEAFVDGKSVGTCDSLATPHRYVVDLTPGEHTITVEVDNTLIHPIGEKGHSYSDAMQTRWNGVIGEISLRKFNPLRDALVIAPWVQDGPQTVTVELPAALAETLTVTAEGLTLEAGKTAPARDGLVARTYTVTSAVQPWSPETPNLYTLTLQAVDLTHQLRIGFRTCTVEGNRFFLNGKPLFVRGNLENCHFPLTGYPVMDKDGWMKILKAQKDEGANQIRFHTWCPPQAAFDAADELGILLSPEAGIWIDGWMTKDFPYLKGLGRGPEAVDIYVQNELKRIIDAYGNSPSFFSLSIGNELGSSDFAKLNAWMEACKAYDGRRRLYAASTARQITAADDFIVHHAYPGLGMIRERLYPGTDWDYESSYVRTKIPTIAHEIGQWPVYPDFDREIPKYTGILRPWNLEILRETSEAAGVMPFVPAWSRSSARTNRLMYKAEIESFLRTPSCAGISLLGIQDYSGQGEALIGWLDSFYDPKPGLEDRVPVPVFFADTVCLARFSKDIWTADETLTVKLLVHHYGAEPLAKEIEWTFAGKSGTVACAAQPGTLTQVAELQLPLADIAAPSRQTLTFGKNRWSIWVYPKSVAEVTVADDVVVTDDYDEAVKSAKAGKRVLFNAFHSGNPKAVLPSAFKPVYWSTTWFPGQRALSLGLLIQDKSPAFTDFPTEDWQDWQWYYLVNSAKTFRLKDMKGYQPLVMPIIDFHKPEVTGLLFEVKVGAGSLLVSGMNLDSGRPEAKQLRASLLKYVSSDAFKPATEVTDAWLAETLQPPKREVAPRPAEYAAAVGYFECAAFTAQKHADVPWGKRLDRAELTAGTYDLTGTGLRTWSDNDGSYWVADELTLTLKGCTNVRGKLLVRFRDPDSGGKRTAEGSFDGARTFTVPAHGKGAGNPDGSYWLTLPVDMEDFLDGKLEFTVKKTAGPNLMIDRVILIPNAD